ncbi:MAG: chemotaxis response regulator protein-glutamate methylesterase [Planctomycetota bacterium]|nr:chemotaxis response regulator protein-glutamate methylesterase [Planctomycetota bacterium]RLT09846.1 MAG: chemotaxis response regulator protein-glutamate methylesterase [Planctomycetota bacterium]
MIGKSAARPAAARPGPVKLDVLIVDDSAVVRQTLKAIVESDPLFKVTTAGDPYEAVEVLKKLVPAVMLLDVEMPRMDGMTFLRKLMRQHPMPVVMCTSIAERALSALEIGAIEVIAKPDWRDPSKMSAWSAGLVESLRNAVNIGQLRKRQKDQPPLASSPEGRLSAETVLTKQPYVNRGVTTEKVIAIGVSTGGVQALHQLLAGFPLDSPGMIIVQHMPADFTPAFAARLNNDPKVELEVHVCRNQEFLRPGQVLIVPGEVHCLVRRSGPGFRIDLVDGPHVNRHKPSVDVLFRSVAQAAGPHSAAALLTGMGDDGAEGLLEIRQAGGLTIAQDEATSTVFGMPREAIKRGAAKLILPLDRIASALHPNGGQWAD